MRCCVCNKKAEYIDGGVSLCNKHFYEGYCRVIEWGDYIGAKKILSRKKQG